MNKLVPMLHPNDMVIGGWDISGHSLDKAMERAAVFPESLQRQLRPLMKDITPMKSIYYPDLASFQRLSVKTWV